MRTVFYLFQQNLLKDVENWLNENTTKNPDVQQWFVKKSSEDYVLYIDFCEDFSDWEPELLRDIENNLKEKPQKYLSADISGRYDGTKEVLWFTKQLLSRFDGFVLDDHTDHLWILEEIQSKKKVQNHRFFDHNGWYKESVKRREIDRNSKLDESCRE